MSDYLHNCVYMRTCDFVWMCVSVLPPPHNSSARFAFGGGGDRTTHHHWHCSPIIYCHILAPKNRILREFVPSHIAVGLFTYDDVKLNTRSQKQNTCSTSTDLPHPTKHRDCSPSCSSILPHLDHTIAQMREANQQLVGVKAFPISLLLTKESQSNYYHGDLDVLYVIAAHLLLSPCLISCQRLIAAEKHTCAQHDPRNTRGPVHPCPMLRTRWRSNLLQIRVENWVDQLCVGHLICGWQLGSPDTGRPRCR